MNKIYNFNSNKLLSSSLFIDISAEKNLKFTHKISINLYTEYMETSEY